MRHAAPFAQTGFSPLRFGLGNSGSRRCRTTQRSPIKHRRIFKPVQHRIGRCIPGTGAQQTHQAGSRAGGGQLPAGFIAHRQACACQHGAHPARQHPVHRHQRHWAAALRQVGQHTGGRGLRFVLGVLRGVQGQSGRCKFSRPIHRHVQRQSDTPLPQAQLQRPGQRLGLKAFQHHQEAGLRGKQQIGRIAGTGSPRQRDARHGRLQRQHRAVHACGQRLSQAKPPFGALGRRCGSGHTGQAPGGLHQTRRQQGLKLDQPGAHQQRASGEDVHGGVMANVIAARFKAAQAAGPVHRGLKARHKMCAVAAGGPRAFSLLHQLRVGHQHHGLRRVRAPACHLIADAGDDGRPRHRGMMLFGYVIHSFSARLCSAAGPRPRENAPPEESAQSNTCVISRANTGKWQAWRP